MANKYLDNDGVLYLWNKVKALVSGAVPTKTSDLTNDSGFITSADVPEGASASTATPLMDGTAAVGTSTAFARGDHRHPSDTSKLDVSTFNTAMGQAQQTMSSFLYVNSKIDGETEGTVLSVNIRDNQTSQNAFDVLTTDGLSTLYVRQVGGKGLSTNDYTTAEKNKLAAFSDASNYALKTDITNMYKYTRSVAAVSDLPSSGNTTGDVYNVEASGMNYAWNGTAWDALGEIFTITAITNSELDTICV